MSRRIGPRTGSTTRGLEHSMPVAKAKSQARRSPAGRTPCAAGAPRSAHAGDGSTPRLCRMSRKLSMFTRRAGRGEHLVDGPEQRLAALHVVVERPDHHAAKALLDDVPGLGADGRDAVVPDRVAGLVGGLGAGENGDDQGVAVV